MYHLLGQETCHDVLKSLARPYLEGPDDVDPGFMGWKRAYQRYVKWIQPYLPSGSPAGPVYVDDPALEDVFLEAFMKESPLDDLPRYRDRTFFENGPAARPQIAEDVRHLCESMRKFGQLDPGFWAAFDLFVNFVLCPVSRYSRGGSGSDCIGVLYLSRTRTYSLRDLYEILVHEFTHTAMFLDERSRPHYGDERLMPLPENWARATVTGMQRPLDKVLHSMVVATEVLLHRDLVLGHDADTVIHPRTPELVTNVLLTIRSMLDLPNRDRLLAPRAFDLMERCHAAVSRLRSGPHPSAAREAPLHA
ncbi:aKG-HExxH-type peptide beta-hydroxylase [Sorangium sp. So ce131]|uniref:aKG-HExxH-type peptide beta-hydroxylase n=1 Tax=Sorangium sp. So ce131 TaxID=3133282 RepID=UPI003F62403B